MKQDDFSIQKLKTQFDDNTSRNPLHIPCDKIAKSTTLKPHQKQIANKSCTEAHSMFALTDVTDEYNHLEVEDIQYILDTITPGMFLETIIGRGAYGTIVTLCSFKTQRCKRVVKISIGSAQSVQNELKMSVLFAKYKLSPKVHNVNIVPTTYYEKYQIMVIEMARVNPLDVETIDLDWLAINLRQLVNRMHAKGYIHGDLHFGNMATKRSGELVMLDMAFAKRSTSMLPDIIQIYRSLSDFFYSPSVKDFFTIFCKGKPEWFKHYLSISKLTDRQIIKIYDREMDV